MKRLSLTPQRLVIAIAAVVLAIAVTLTIVLTQTARGASPENTPASTAATATATPSATPTTAPYAAPTRAQMVALPEAVYNVVIPGLVPFAEPTIPASATAAYTLSGDTAIYGSDKVTPVARFATKNFLNQDTIVVPVAEDGPWALVMTPSRQSLPSANGGTAPAQTAGWIRRDLMVKSTDLGSHVVVSVSAQTVSIVAADGKVEQSFPAGVGATATPTPTGVVGYIQARYLDAAQGQGTYPLNLTSLHSSAADEPYGGNDGGLIGVHYEAVATGQISHGCVRLSAAGVTAINTLPVGTLVQIVA